MWNDDLSKMLGEDWASCTFNRSEGRRQSISNALTMTEKLMFSKLSRDRTLHAVAHEEHRAILEQSFTVRVAAGEPDPLSLFTSFALFLAEILPNCLESTSGTCIAHGDSRLIIRKAQGEWRANALHITPSIRATIALYSALSGRGFQVSQE